MQERAVSDRNLHSNVGERTDNDREPTGGRTMQSASDRGDALTYMLTGLTLGDLEDDVCVYDDERLVYASYDNGRTQVLDTRAQQSRGLMEILKDTLLENYRSA